MPDTEEEIQETIEAPILEIDEPTDNNHVYTREAAEQVVEQINEGGVIGTPDLSNEFDEDTQEFNTENISHVASNARIEDGKVKADIEILENEHGDELLEKIGEGVFRTSCTAEPDEEDGQLIIGESIQVTSCSFVHKRNDSFDL